MHESKNRFNFRLDDQGKHGVGSMEIDTCIETRELISMALEMLVFASRYTDRACFENAVLVHGQAWPGKIDQLEAIVEMISRGLELDTPHQESVEWQ
ncbi:MAG: hypothetical protein IR164_12050 [Devosia sp.]|uniref:hypothetical protein n=1 Tax=Devosia sp. TaxID=1871048 RepID=UPI001A09AABA|nr:hypothetical protein [Devosia sp.]MBF0679655.1 hypothetical protein [Devosia sp.]